MHSARYLRDQNTQESQSCVMNADRNIDSDESHIHHLLTLVMVRRAGSQADSRSCTSTWTQLPITLKQNNTFTQRPRIEWQFTGIAPAVTARRSNTGVVKFDYRKTTNYQSYTNTE